MATFAHRRFVAGEKTTKMIRLAGSAIVAVAVFISALSGGQKSPPPDAECLSCHGRNAVSETKLRIDESLLGSSVHRGLECTACHAVEPGKSRPGIPHQKDIPDPNCTARCHREDRKSSPGLDPLFYPDSVHGRAYLERGVRDVARCWDCHGKHNIRSVSDPESPVNRKNIPLMCSACHDDMAVVVKYHIHRETPYQEYLKSVHGRAVFVKGLPQVAAVCTDCHGIHDIKGVGEPQLMARSPETCGRCHGLIFNEYRESIHGRETLAGNPDSPLCVDCHGEHGIVSPKEGASPASRKRVHETCSSCHSRPEIMAKYGISADKIGTFINSLHGIAVGFGSAAAATCSSCHGIHDIRPASDPKSSVHPANLRQTCGQVGCHPNMPETIASARIHIGPDPDTSPGLFLVQRILLVLVLIALSLTVVWFIPGFIRKSKLIRRR